MKATVAPYATMAVCLRIVTRSGNTYRLTRHPRDLTMSGGQVYLSGSGYDFTGYASSSGLNPSAIDLQGILGFAGVTRDQIAGGEFDGARCYLFACNYLAPIEDYEPIVASILGKATLTDEGYRIEEMALIDALNQSVGRTYKAQCDKVFGGTEYAGCGVALAPLTVAGTLTAVTSNAIVRDSARTEAADRFAYGTLAFTSGANAGLPARQVKRYEADGTIELFEPLFFAPAIGDAYTMIPGCRKRFAEDCVAKYANGDNFGGFPYVPTGSQYGQVGTK